MKRFPPKEKAPTQPRKVYKPSYLDKKKPQIDNEGLRALLDEVEKSKNN